jgi:hypothetical protein
MITTGKHKNISGKSRGGKIPRSGTLITIKIGMTKYTVKCLLY